MATTTQNSIKERIPALLTSVLEGSNIGKAYHPVIKNMVVNFLKGTSDSEIRELVENFRDEIIPWLLGESNDNTN